MKTVLVASSKGGVGKTTIATHLAAHAALDGLNTVLVDADPQGSSTRWAHRRSTLDSAVLPLDGTGHKRWRHQLPGDSQQVVIDAAAGAMAADLESFLVAADAVGLVANKLRPWTNASQQAVELLQQWPYPVVAQLRDSQAYVFLSGLGKSLFDYHSAQVRDHQADWQPLLRWLKKSP